MRCHSCDAWVEKNASHCPICGWRVEEWAEEPAPTLLPTPISNRTRTEIRRVVKTVGRLVTIGIWASEVACPESEERRKSQNVTKRPEPEKCLRLKPGLLNVDCAFGARCELAEPLPDRTIRRHEISKICPPKWKQMATLGMGTHIAQCTRHLQVRETRTKLVQVVQRD
jgi:hypothetical protein